MNDVLSEFICDALGVNQGGANRRARDIYVR